MAGCVAPSPNSNIVHRYYLQGIPFEEVAKEPDPYPVFVPDERGKTPVIGIRNKQNKMDWIKIVER